MKNGTNVSNVIMKSHSKSIIRAFLIGSKEFESIFSTSPCGDIEHSTYHVVVLQTMVCSNYIIVEYVSEDDYKYYDTEAKHND